MTIYYMPTATQFPTAIYNGMFVKQAKAVIGLIRQYREGTRSYIMLRRRKVKRGYKLILAEVAADGITQVKKPEIYFITPLGVIEPRPVRYRKGGKVVF